MEETDKTCEKCGDKLRGHEDESGTQCKWCVQGWVVCDEDDCNDQGVG